jgi:hypothetical protein
MSAPVEESISDCDRLLMTLWQLAAVCTVDRKKTAATDQICHTRSFRSVVWMAAVYCRHWTCC